MPFLSIVRLRDPRAPAHRDGGYGHQLYSQARAGLPLQCLGVGLRAREGSA